MADSLFPLMVTTTDHENVMVTREMAEREVRKEDRRGPYREEMVQKLPDDCLLQELGTCAVAYRWRFVQLADGSWLDFVKFSEQMWKEYHESK